MEDGTRTDKDWPSNVDQKREESVSRAPTEMLSEIDKGIELIRQRYALLELDDWNHFYSTFRSISQLSVDVWRLIRGYHHQELVAEARAAAEEMLRQGHCFGAISINDIRLTIEDGRVEVVRSDYPCVDYVDQMLFE